MTDQLDVKAIRAMCDKATPGPWEVHEALGDFYVIDADGQNVACFAEVYPECAVSLDEHDAAIIAQSRTLIPKLCDRVKSLEAENAQLRDELERLQSALDTLYGAKFSERGYHALKDRADNAELERDRLRAELDALKAKGKT